MTRAKKVYVRSNGCPGQELDVARLVSYFEANGCRITFSPRRADHIVFLTCCAIESRKEDSLRRIARYQELKGDLIVGGCLPDIAADEFKARHPGKFVTSKDIPRIDAYFPEFKIKYRDVPDAHFLFPKLSMIAEKALAEFELSRKFYQQVQTSGIFDKRKVKRPYIRIGRGCNEKCAYCGIRKAIGPLQSKPVEACVKEYEALLQQGHRSFKIFADNTGAYGADIGSSLPELLDRMGEVHDGMDVDWFVVHLEPVWVIKHKAELLKWVSRGVISELLYPIQSGCDRVLHLMGRGSNADTVLQCILDIKRANPALKVNTQVIVGFPSETEEELQETLDFVKQVGFDLVMPFRYYDTPSATAHGFEGKIDAATIERRFRRTVQFLDRERIPWVEL